MLVVMFENPGRPVIFAQLYVGFKLYFLLEKYRTSSNFWRTDSNNVCKSRTSRNFSQLFVCFKVFFSLKNTGHPVISQGWVKMFENPGRPVIFAQLYVGFKLYILLEKYRTSSNLEGRPWMAIIIIMFTNPGCPGIFHNCLYVSKFSFPWKIPDVQ